MSYSSKQIEIPELISFLLVTVSMFVSAFLLFPSYYLFFIVLSLIDGLSTYAKIRLFLTIDRALFGIALIFMSSTLLNFSVIGLVIETLIVIVILDFASLLRRLTRLGEPMTVVKLRLRSYLFSAVPAGVFSIGMVYIYSVVFLASTPSPVLELGLASAGIFLVIVYIMRMMSSMNSIKRT